LAIGATVGRAQAPADSIAGRKQASSLRGDRLAAPAGLELTAEQKTKLAAITNRHAEEGRTVGELFQTDPDAAMKRMVTLRTKMQSEVRTVLTPEQRAIFDRNVAEMNALMNAHRPTAPH
jgi:Spy/CpxP family protein refolding chaperone